MADNPPIPLTAPTKNEGLDKPLTSPSRVSIVLIITVFLVWTSEPLCSGLVSVIDAPHAQAQARLDMALQSPTHSRQAFSFFSRRVSSSYP